MAIGWLVPPGPFWSRSACCCLVGRGVFFTISCTVHRYEVFGLGLLCLRYFLAHVPFLAGYFRCVFYFGVWRLCCSMVFGWRADQCCVATVYFFAVPAAVISRVGGMGILRQGVWKLKMYMDIATFNVPSASDLLWRSRGLRWQCRFLVGGSPFIQRYLYCQTYDAHVVQFSRGA